MKKVIKTLLTFTMVMGLIMCPPVEKVNAEVSVPLLESGWNIAAYIQNTDRVSEYGQNTGSGDGPAAHMLDNNPNSWWHSHYKGDNGSGHYSIIIKFNEALEFDKVQGAGRSAANGKIETYEIYTINSDNPAEQISSNSDRWELLVNTSNAIDGGFEYVCGSTITATHVKIDVHDTQGGDGRFGCLAELDFYKNYERYEVAETATPLDSSAFVISESGNSEGNMNKIFDGDATTFWTSQGVDHVKNGEAWLQVDMGAVEKINRIDYTKRYHNSDDTRWRCTGNIREYIVEAKLNENDDWTVVSTGDISFDENSTIYNDITQGGTHQIEFDAVKARYIRIRANASYHYQPENINRFMTVADLKIYSVTPDVKGFVDNYVSNDSSSGFTFAEAKTNSLKNLSSGTVQVTYKLDESAVNVDKKMVLFAVSDNTKDNQYYTVWVNPRANKIGVDFTGNSTTPIFSLYIDQSLGVNTQDTEWHTITIRNTNTGATFNGADGNGVYMQFDQDYRATNKYTGTERIGFATRVSNANSATVGYVDLATADEGKFIGTIGKLNVFSTVLENDEVTANHQANVKELTTGEIEIKPLELNRWVKNHLHNPNYIFESVYDAIGSKGIPMEAYLTSEQYLLRYVTKDVLSIKAQSEIVEEGKVNVRFVTSVASGNLKNVKFKIEILNGESVTKTGTVKTEKVYRQIAANDGSKVYFQNAQTVFGQDLSTYFAVSKLNNIPDTAVSQSVRVTPYWLPLGANDEDKNYVEGVSRTFSIQTFFENAHDSTTIKEGE